MEKDMRNYRKRLAMTASAISALSYDMASAVLARFAAGTLGDAQPVMPIEPFRIGRLPGWAFAPVHKHGCNKRGGRSKRARGLNYWRN